jgi:hypothetical protein
VNYGDYHGQTLAQMQTKRWRLSTEVVNGYVRIPAGTEVTIIGKRMGLNIEGKKCEHCGVSVFVSKVLYSEVEEIT